MDVNRLLPFTPGVQIYDTVGPHLLDRVVRFLLLVLRARNRLCVQDNVQLDHQRRAMASIVGGGSAYRRALAVNMKIYGLVGVRRSQ